MPDSNEQSPPARTAENSALRLRVAKLFEYLKAYVEMRYPPVRDVTAQQAVIWIDELPDHPSIEVKFGTPEPDLEESESEVLVRITRPVTTDCPRPPAELTDWVDGPWRDPNGEARVRPAVNRPSAGGTVVESFNADPERLLALEDWRDERAMWAEAERPAREALAVFQKVYEWYGALERQSETTELLVGDGLVECNDVSGRFSHPVLLQKLELQFDPERPHPEFVFRKREQPPELYQEFLRVLPGVNLTQLARCADELKAAEFAPLGEGDTDGFLRRLIQGLFPPTGTVATDKNGNGRHDVPTLTRRPALFRRERRTGPSNIFDLILQDIATRDAFSPALAQMLGLGAATSFGPPSTAAASAYGNEDAEVLFGKPANREQLAIAQQLRRRNCVVVQGPPGTGKTHTIANIIGDLLAQGKRVLVTAHTPKALKVLRQKVVEEVRPLCVSVLQNDKSSQEDLQQAVRQIHVRLGDDEVAVEREVRRIAREREQLLAQLSATRRELLNARGDEIRDIVFGGASCRPIEAARKVKAGENEYGWIPSPVNLGEALPLSPAELATLYQTAARVSLADEREIAGYRPDLSQYPTPKEFRSVFEETTELAKFDLRFREELWSVGNQPADLAVFDAVLEDAKATIEFLRDIAPWQLDAVQAGRDGEHAVQVWKSLIDLIESSWRESHECHTLIMEHGPAISSEQPPHETVALLDEIVAHLRAGKTFGLVTKLTKARWFEFQKIATVGGRQIDLSNGDHLAAVRALARLQQLRAELRSRWERQMAPKGGLAVAELGDRPEQVCRQFVPMIDRCLKWHASTWLVLEGKFQQVGFNCAEFIASCCPECGDHAELKRLRRGVVEHLGTILASRGAYLRHTRLTQQINAWRILARITYSPEAAATQRLRWSVLEGNSTEYEAAHGELWRLQNLEADLKERRELLRKLERGAPAWASAVENRVGVHGQPHVPGDPLAAWEWRQLYDELERRASVSLPLLQQRTEELGKNLLKLTAALIDQQTWLNQIRQTASEQKQALGAYAALRNKITKSGTGARDAELRAAARREMAIAKDAVPVWIMPLGEVAETFDPRKSRFDVVIIDEASQCDPTALFALYMAKQTIIVGDDEQVTPVAVGVRSSEVSELMAAFLTGIPHKELYDGETSVYELAQIAFGGVIRLTEHFRCAPDIIAFSNALSYKGEIKPLREAASVPLNPHVVVHRVADGYSSDNNVNDAEAETIASLICAAIERPEYKESDEGKPTTFGVVSLLGAEQALKIDTVLRQRLDPVLYRRHQLLCGDSAQFQGDERDVMFISVVNGPTGSPPLAMRQEGPKKIFKKRYNVAASRARNQMWVVHSLNHEVDLQAGDFRRRLIEHAIDPKAWHRELEQRIGRIDPNSTAFEGPVLRRLMERGFDVIPQYQAGAYRIDLVVVGKHGRLAVECDGEKYHGADRLEQDVDRQAILERLGWKFVRIRGSVFFRDEERALAPVFQRLAELGIEPRLKTDAKPPAPDDTIQGLVSAADAVRAKWRDPQTTAAGEATPSVRPVRAIRSSNRTPVQNELGFGIPNSSRTSAAGLRQIRVSVTAGSINQNLLPLGDHVNAGTVAIGETMKISTSSGARFESEIIEQGKRLRARGDIAQFYRDANVNPGDIVVLEEREKGHWHLSKFAVGANRRGPATVRDIIGR